MGIERDLIAARVAAEGRVVRVVLAEVRGSAPREAGAAMILGPAGQDGTIGGGALEMEAAELAQGLEHPRVLRRALGPELGQCCGGAVTLVLEPWDAARLADIGTGGVLRPVAPDAAPDAPLALRRALAQARGGAGPVGIALLDGWLLEPVDTPARHLWIWGAGHVGRALVATLAPLPGLAITWVDTDRARFPARIPAGVTCLPAADPAVLAAHAPASAEHLILTYSHAIDLALCDALLRRGFSACGLIGSATKWARFRTRLAGAGHTGAEISRIRCPIGDPAFGKHPQAIAISVAADLLSHAAQQDAGREKIA